MGRIILILFILGNALSTRSQEIRGRVVDENNISVPGVHVNHGGYDGITDRNGRFEIRLSHPDSLITFSMIGYRRTFLVPSQLDTGLIIVKLIPAVNDLEAFEIYSENISLFHTDLKDEILDYGFVDSHILILKRRGTDYFLDLLTETDSLLYRFNLVVKPQRLHTDCFGRMHLLANQGVFEITVPDNVITLLSYPASGFEAVVEPCQCELPDLLLFHRYASDNQSLDYVALSKSEGRTKVFARIYDDEGTARAAKYRQVINNTHVRNRMDDIWIGELQAIRDHEEDIMLYDRILTKPIYCPVFYSRDSVYLFDHINDSLMVMSPDGSRIRSSGITYHRSRLWSDQLLQDRHTGLIYSICERKGVLCCHNVNLNNGKAEELICTGFGRTKLPAIHKKTLYFLASSDHGSVVNRLYRCRLP